MATDNQVDFLKKLVRQNWLFKSDFPSARKYRLKRELSFDEAHALIDLAMDRRRRLGR